MQHEIIDQAFSEVLPILLFDERRLTPAFGYVFNPKWVDTHESIVSILWKFARMNALPGHIVAGQLGKCTVDPYEGVNPTRDAVDIYRLRDILKLPLKTLRGALIPARWAGIASVNFRYCTKCLRRGYHGVLHQLETIQHCPMHGTWLQTECRHCGRTAPLRLNARLLDTPFRCWHCRQLYAPGQPLFLHRRELSLTARIALTRTRLRYAA